MGVDRRLPGETESGTFRIVDEALAAYLAARPDRVSLGLDWSDSLVIDLRAERAPTEVAPMTFSEHAEAMPAALAEMAADRRAKHEKAAEAARHAAVVRLPDRLRRSSRSGLGRSGSRPRSSTMAATLRLVVAVPGGTPDADQPEATAGLTVPSVTEFAATRTPCAHGSGRTRIERRRRAR